MTRTLIVTGLLAGALFQASELNAASPAKVTIHGKPSGRQALAAVRHDWKAQVAKTVRGKQANVGRVPANFGKLSPAARLAYLHARRGVNPTRFDRYHPHLGPILARDDRLRMAQSQDCRPLSGLIPNTSLTRYLHYRRSLNPARFDLYHATTGAILAEDDLLRSGKGCVSPELIPPPVAVLPPIGTPSPIPPIGGGPNQTAVPEPGSLTLILLGSAGAMTPRLVRWWKRRPKLDVG